MILLIRGCLILVKPSRFHNSRRIKYRGCRFQLYSFKLCRENICSICGFSGKTVLHHVKYEFSLEELKSMKHSWRRDEKLLKNTVEVCVSCHRRLHSGQQEMGLYKNLEKD